MYYIFRYIYNLFKKSKYELKTLAPTIDDKHPSIDFIKTAVEDKNNLNIGIVGSYGSGKSSLIKSYETKFKKKFLYISLAELNENNENNTLKQRLEKAIVNQIINQIDPSRIRQSFLKSKKDKKYGRITIVIFITIWLFFFNIPTNYKYILDLFPNLKDISYSIPLLNINLNIRQILFLATIGFSFCFIYQLIRNLTFSSIIKLKSEFYEVETKMSENNSNDNYFDKHLDDILYCISQSKCDGIVFEDIDRFNDQEIFIKLKEINFLLSNRYKFGRHIDFRPKPIPFIYAVNDYLFESENKTKFFDIIIPVIPYVNGGNSFEQFQNLFNKTKTLDKPKLRQPISRRYLVLKKSKSIPDDIVLNMLSYYITDMRLLKNIYNEYKVYIVNFDEKQFKKNKNQDFENKLFALIVYKNLYPKDFSDLQYSKGYLCKMINSKDALLYEIMYENMVDKFEGMSEYEEQFCRLEILSDISKLSTYEKCKIIKSIPPEYIKNKLPFCESIDENHLKFIHLLLIHNLIDKDYWYYLSYIHHSNSSKEDIDFIRSIDLYGKPEYKIELKNMQWIMEQIISRMHNKMYLNKIRNNDALLNVSLLAYLMDESDINNEDRKYKKNKKKIYYYILELIGSGEKYFSFIISYYQYVLRNQNILKIKKDLIFELYKHNHINGLELLYDIFKNYSL